MRELQIGGRRIADDTDTYVIADIGHDRWGDLERAQVLFLQAAMAGAHAVALDAGSLFAVTRYDQPDGEPYGGRVPPAGHREFGRAEYAMVAELAADAGLDLVPTAFDRTSVEFLRDLGTAPPAVRIGPADLADEPLLKDAAGLGRPLLVGVRDAGADEVRRAVDAVLPVNPDLALLQCAEPYPRTATELRLGGIVTLLAGYPDLVVGFAGNDVCPEQSWIAHAVGARVVAKRVPPDRGGAGRHHRLALDPLGLVRYDGGRRWGGGVTAPVRTGRGGW